MIASISDLEKHPICHFCTTRHAPSISLSLKSSPYQPHTAITTCFTSFTTTESINRRSRLSCIQKPTSVGAVTQNSSTPEFLALSSTNMQPGVAIVVVLVAMTVAAGIGFVIWKRLYSIFLARQIAEWLERHPASSESSSSSSS